MNCEVVHQDVNQLLGILLVTCCEELNEGLLRAKLIADGTCIMTAILEAAFNLSIVVNVELLLINTWVCTLCSRMPSSHGCFGTNQRIPIDHTFIHFGSSFQLSPTWFEAVEVLQNLLCFRSLEASSHLARPSMLSVEAQDKHGCKLLLHQLAMQRHSSFDTTLANPAWQTGCSLKPTKMFSLPSSS